jgi:hypothetical protein
MYKSVCVPNPNENASRFNGRKRGNGTMRRWHTKPPIDIVGPHYYGKNDGMKDAVVGNRQRWVKRRTLNKRQARIGKAQMRVSVGL